MRSNSRTWATFHKSAYAAFAGLRRSGARLRGISVSDGNQSEKRVMQERRYAERTTTDALQRDDEVEEEGLMFSQAILVAVTIISGVIGTLLKDPPAWVKTLLVALTLLSGLATAANNYHDAREAERTRNQLVALLRNRPPPPDFEEALRDAVEYVAHDHNLTPLNNPKLDAEGWTEAYNYAGALSLLKQEGSKSVTDVTVLDEEDSAKLAIDYVSDGGKAGDGVATLICDIRQTFFEEPCFENPLLRTIASWFWKSQAKFTNYDYLLTQTNITNYDYLFKHLCDIAQNENPDAKNIGVDLKTGDKAMPRTARGCGVDITSGETPKLLTLTLEENMVQQIFSMRPSRFYAAVYEEFRKQFDKEGGQKPTEQSSGK